VAGVATGGKQRGFFASQPGHAEHGTAARSSNSAARHRPETLKNMSVSYINQGEKEPTQVAQISRKDCRSAVSRSATGGRAEEGRPHQRAGPLLELCWTGS
jgi:hypothetical protein